MQSVFLSLLAAVAFAVPVLGQDDGPQPGPEAGPLPIPVGPSPEDPIVEIEFVGLETYDRSLVTKFMGLELGKPFPNQVEQAKAIQVLFRTYGIVLGIPQFVAVDGGWKVTVPVTELPLDLEPQFIGMEKVKLEKLREWGGLFDREQIYVHEAENIADRIARGYRRQGFHFAEVDIVTHPGSAGAGVDVVFEIREGPLVRVKTIEVVGNESLPDTGWGLWRGGLRRLSKLETKAWGWLRWWGGKFDEEVFLADLQAMREVYRAGGWRDAVVSFEPYRFTEDRSGVHLKVIIDEGVQYRVRSINFEVLRPVYDEQTQRYSVVPDEGGLIFDEAELRAELQLEVGGVIEMDRVNHDHQAMGRFYGNRGYIPQLYFEDNGAGGFEWLEPRIVPNAETNEVDVTYRFTQGRKRTVNEIRFVGTTNTRDRVVRREIGVLPGDVADMTRIERGLARLRSTRYFDDQYDSSHPPPIVTLEVDPRDPDKVNVIYEVEEGRVVDLNVSGGVTSDLGLLGLLSISMKNFAAANQPSSLGGAFGEIYRKEALHGNGETFQLDLAPGSEISYYKFFWEHPDIFGRHFNRISTSFGVEGRTRRFRSHDEDRFSGNVRFGYLFEQGDLSLYGGLNIQQIELSDLGPAAEIPDILERSAADTEFLGIDLTATYSSLDHRYSPRNGTYVSWANTIYGGPFGGDNDVWKSKISVDWYTEVGDPNKDVRPGIYLGGEIGVAHPYGDTDEVHYAERMFFGGASTIRGFDFRGVGPVDGLYPIGGETGLLLKAEYRHPLYTVPIKGTSRRQEMLRGFLFLEGAVLDPDSFRLDLEDHRASYGFGFALTNPLPIKFSFGFPLRDHAGDDLEVFSFGLDFR